MQLFEILVKTIYKKKKKIDSLLLAGFKIACMIDATDASNVRAHPLFGTGSVKLT